MKVKVKWTEILSNDTDLHTKTFDCAEDFVKFLEDKFPSIKIYTISTTT